MTINNRESNGGMSILGKDKVDTKFVGVLQDIISQLMDGTIDKDKASRMVLSETHEQRTRSCYVCHKTIEAGEEAVTKSIDPVTDQQPTGTYFLEGSYIPIRSRHSYHPSFTNPDLGFHKEEDDRLRDKFRK
jgi:hypothetical protein|tara:strand:+ start:2217 stop:2612 length:396 start_codon:yes stop_codon:yes gene_type:complete